MNENSYHGLTADSVSFEHLFASIQPITVVLSAEAIVAFAAAAAAVAVVLVATLRSERETAQNLTVIKPAMYRADVVGQLPPLHAAKNTF